MAESYSFFYQPGKRSFTNPYPVKNFDLFDRGCTGRISIRIWERKNKVSMLIADYSIKSSSYQCEPDVEIIH